MTKKFKKQIIKKAFAIGGTFLFKQAVEAFVDKKTDKTIPNEPDNPQNDQTWKQAVAYAAFSGAFLGTMKLVIDRVADNKLEG